MPPVPHAQPSDKPETVLAGRYRLLGRIGDGSTGVVWRAHDTVLSRDVALKTQSAASAQSGALNRMLVEAKALARVEHPAIVRVLDFGAREGAPAFVVMELLQGEDLERYLARESPMDPVEAVRLLLPVLDGLALAHERGILHRDLKPANIFLAKTARGAILPKLIDFGLAKVEGEGRNMTGAGVIFGSPHYMAPERVQAEPATVLSDLWAMAATLFEMIAGFTPFEGATQTEVMRAVLQREPRALPAAIDRDLAVIVERGLRKEAGARWPSARLFGQQLARWLEARGVVEDVSGNPLGPTWRGERENTGTLDVDSVPVQSIRPSQLPSVHPAPAAEGPVAIIGSGSPAATVVSRRDAPASRSITPPPQPRLSRRLLGGLLLVAVLAVAGIVVATRGEPPARSPAADAGPRQVP